MMSPVGQPLVVAWWMWAIIALVAIVFMACAVLKLHEVGVYPLRDITKLIRRPWFEVVLISFMVGGLIQYGATKGTNGTDQAGEPMLSVPPLATSGGGVSVDATNDVGWVEGLCFTGILPMSNAVRLTVAWPTNLFCNGTMLDFFTKNGALTNEWSWVDEVSVLAGSTNVVKDVAYPAGELVPSSMFFTVKDRFASALTMSDADRDGIPDVYELHYGTNPYVADSELVPRLTVGPHGDYRSIEAALAASTDYSVISVEPGVHELTNVLDMPEHPVMIEGPVDGYAVLRSDQRIAAIRMESGEGRGTVFRNLIVDLRCHEDFQAAFWIGGNTPWTGRGASATFENVRVRANYPGTEYFGWQFYRDEGGPSLLKNCTMNAAGATWAYGVSMFNAASNVIEDCAFLNMPTNADEGSQIAVLIRDSAHGIVDLRVPEERSDLSWAGCPLSGTYDSTADSDGDGLSDHDEVFVDGTDPWLADSDGDGMTDGEERIWQTDPRDVASHLFRIDVSVTNTVCYPDTTNYVFLGDVESWRSNLLCSDDGVGFVTNLIVRTMAGGIAGAFVDIDRDGEFDASKDVLQTVDIDVRQSQVALRFAFGDVDRDGVNDKDERDDGTDPFDANSHRVRRGAKIVNRDSVAAVTNYYGVALHKNADGVEWIAAIDNPQGLAVDSNAVEGVVYLSCYRDFNRNGRYDEGVEPMYIAEVKTGSEALQLAICDCDADGVPDSAEWAEGTDPTDRGSFCFDPSVSIHGIYRTPGFLSVEAHWGTNALLGPVLATNWTFEAGFGHLRTDSGEKLVVSFWDDANSNGVREASERSVQVGVSPYGHVTYYLGELPLGDFDMDRNGLLDWWENETGLSSLDDRAMDYDDADNDGLVNLHEFWAGTDPLTPDGSNTLLSVCARSVDDRIRDIADPSAAVDRFVDFHANGTNGVFVANTNFWAKDLDFGCVSVWRGERTKGNGERSATAITRKHVVMAAHFYDNTYVFCDTNGVSYSRMVSSSQQIPNTDLLLGRLNEDLPDTVSIPKILPADYSELLSTGKYLPVVCMTQAKSASVAELAEFNCSVVSATDNKRYYMLGRTDSTNHVSAARTQIRAATIDGNSGSPVFLVVGNQLVHLFSKHLGWADPVWRSQHWGPMISHYAETVQGYIDSWEGDDANRYQLEFFSLESFKETNMPRR